MYLRCPSAKMVSKASDDLPEPDRPVMTTSRSRGMSTSMFFRLCSRAPRTRMNRSGGGWRRGSGASVGEGRGAAFGVGFGRLFRGSVAARGIRLPPWMRS